MLFGRDLARRLAGMRRQPAKVLLHALLVAASLTAAFLLRFDFALTLGNWQRLAIAAPILLFIRLPLFAVYHLYSGLWKYTGVSDLVEIFRAVTLGSVIFSVSVLFLYGHGFPRSVLLIEYVLTLGALSGGRTAYRALRESRQGAGTGALRRAVVVGAGDAADLLIREIRRNPTLPYRIVGILDDDPAKDGLRLHGIEVEGPIDRLPELSEEREVEEVLIAIPSASLSQRRRIAALARDARVVFRRVPDLKSLLQGRARIDQLQEVDPENVLLRDAIELDLARIRDEIQGRTVLVTGAAGSIGSELCRQVSGFGPARLVLLERAESPLHLLRLELQRMRPGLEVITVIGDVQDRERVAHVMRTHRPDVVYHAAAYKHVHLMEEWPIEAIRNNVIGTGVVAEEASRAGVGKFVLISTDKAVRPVGIMGMTKRVAEDLLRSMNGGGTRFVAVRFGNVLGSQGSVLPIFKWQVANGGPVTVTDPDAKRYFMLTSEAAQLVIQAAALGEGGEVFFLDMGEPVRILDLAENVIRMSGLEPGRDIEVEIVGLKPGERLNEELVKEEEVLTPTAHEKVRRVQDGALDVASFRTELGGLLDAVERGDVDEAVRRLRALAASH